MTDKSQTCPDCGCSIPEGVLEGMCPECLLQTACGLAGDGEPVTGATPDWREATTTGGRDEANTDAPMSAEGSGALIGRYKLLRKIGEGGFGTVYLAEQTEPVTRRVALKLIKPGMDSREVIARFEAERQALALMDHPNIARVHDAGATELGRPYFVMELVRGVPITQFCEENALGTEDRLKLFMEVCGAVQHAHQKGIIHRDLKPSNILVSLRDGIPVAKVIDFGIAKAITFQLTDKTVFTALGRMIGTPQYMSPEQAELNALDIDTRSDIYSLGVVLYELLTGRSPLDPEVLRTSSHVEIQRMIRLEVPLKPSAQLILTRQQLTAPEPSGSAKRVTFSGTTTIGRDLDWIVMQALEKDRNRRYQTANGLVLDIQRYLQHEPVSASPPSVSYRLIQFAMRHRTGVAWAAVFAVAAVLATIAMTMLYFHAENEARRALKQRQRAIEAGNLAERSTWEAKVAQAAALRWSNKAGRRFEAMQTIKEASNLPINVDSSEKGPLRNSLIACLQIVDMRPHLVSEGAPDWGEMVVTDASLEKVAHAYEDGRIVVTGLRERPQAGNLPKVMELTPLAVLPGAGEPVKKVLRFSPDGSRLATGYGSGTDWQLELWQPGSSAPPFNAGQGIHEAFAFHPGGKFCAIGRKDITEEGGRGLISFIDLDSGAELRRIPLSHQPYSIAFDADGMLMAVSLHAADRVDVIDIDIDIDTEAGRTEASYACRAPRAVAWSPAEPNLAVCCEDNLLQVWQHGDSPEAPLEIPSPTGVVAWSPDGRVLASVGKDDTVRLWDPFQGALLSSHHGRAASLQFSPEGDRLGFLREGEKLTLLEVATADVCYRGRRHDRGDTDAPVVSESAWNPEGSLMATTGNDGVRLWNRKGRHLGHLPVPGAQGVAFGSDALLVASSNGLQKWTVSSEEMPDKTMETTFREPVSLGSFQSCGQLAFYQDGKEAFLAMTGKGIDPATKTEVNAVWLVDPAHDHNIRCLGGPSGVDTCDISSDGRWLAAGSRLGENVMVWDLSEPNPQPMMLKVHGAARVRVAFSPELSRVGPGWLMTSDMESYCFWRIGSWECARELESNMAGSVGRMAFSPRLTALAIARNRDELQVLNPFTLDELSSPDFDKEIPLNFDPHGMIMVTFGQKKDGGIFFWRLDAVRTELSGYGLDWEELPAFSDPGVPLVKRVRLPKAP